MLTDFEWMGTHKTGPKRHYIVSH